jgi:hypothetical protein
LAAGSRDEEAAEPGTPCAWLRACVDPGIASRAVERRHPGFKESQGGRDAGSDVVGSGAEFFGEGLHGCVESGGHAGGAQFAVGREHAVSEHVGLVVLSFGP